MKRQLVLPATMSINVIVKGKYNPGSLATLEDPAESPDFEVDEIWYNGVNITSLVDSDDTFDWDSLLSNLSDDASNIEPDLDDYND